MHSTVGTLLGYLKEGEKVKKEARKGKNWKALTPLETTSTFLKTNRFHYNTIDYLQLIDDTIKILHEGKLTAPEHAPKVVIVGAGMSGLIAAAALKPYVHVEIVEGNPTRFGGRIFTHRFGYLKDKEGKPLDPQKVYVDFGAMRLPFVEGQPMQPLVFKLIDLLGVKTAPFNTDNPKALYYVNGVKTTVVRGDADPDILGFDVYKSEKGITASQLFSNATQSIIKEASVNRLKYDESSIRSFLKFNTAYSEPAIESIGVMLDEEALMYTSFLESIRDQSDTSLSLTYKEIVGGMENLILAVRDQLHLSNLIHVDRKAIRIRQTENKVSVITRDSEGKEREYEADYGIVTVPYSRLKHMHYDTAKLSAGKRRAIRELHYDHSCKIALVFSRRWWHDLDIKGGGASTTDLPIRYIFYPTHGDDNPEEPCVLLASYTWSEDAQSYEGMEEEEALQSALDDIVTVHVRDGVLSEKDIRDSYLGGKIWKWSVDQWTLGAFAMFAPGQQTSLYETGYISDPEGRFHFAGEHTSLLHAWIEGAIESGLRTAAEVLQQAGIFTTKDVPFGMEAEPAPASVQPTDKSS